MQIVIVLEKGIELIFQEYVRINNEVGDEEHHDVALIDSILQ